MDIIYGKAFSIKNTAICLGKFDGVHAGHRKLLSCIQKAKEKNGLSTAIFTFQMHPGTLFGTTRQQVLTTLVEKTAILEQEHIDTMIAYPFTKETAAMEPEDFVKEVLCSCCDAKWIVVGEDFRFGKQRRGDVSLLQEMAGPCGYTLQVVPKVEKAGNVVSSTRIRACVEAGDMEQARELLQIPYHIAGTVVQGNQLGRTFGMPTANLLPEEEKLLPPYGVYAATVNMEGSWYSGITNIGEKPTIEGASAVGVETHIFAELPQFYGSRITVCLHHFIRPERKFPSVVELKKQMEEDAKKAKEILQKHPFPSAT